MSTTRRAFIDRLATGGAAFGGLALLGSVLPSDIAAATAESRHVAQGEWDTRWTERLTGRIRTCFDVPEVESGYGVWRATIWARQYEATLGIPARELSTALVLRHNAIVLAMQQSFWDRYGVADVAKATHPLTGEATRRNPALLGAADGVGDPYAQFSLPAFLSRGGVALACDLALQDMVALVAKVDGVSPTVARERAIAGLVPGVILQPSGVFAVLYAQQTKQALYIRAS
jgi:hypothetical protein